MSCPDGLALLCRGLALAVVEGVVFLGWATLAPLLINSAYAVVGFVLWGLSCGVWC